eukprot:g15781.t2
MPRKARVSKKSKGRDGKDASVAKRKGSGRRKTRATAVGKAKEPAAGEGDREKNKPEKTARARKARSSSAKEASTAPTRKRDKGDGGGDTEGRKWPLLLTVVPAELGNELRWVPLHPGGAAAPTATDDSTQSAESDPARFLKFSWGGVAELADTRDLCATGPAFELALADGDPAIGSAVQHFRVLARMTPGLKEELATLLMDAGKTVLMCGDGSNDVGALRRSHVGLALLSGFGDTNTRTDTTPPGVTSPSTVGSAQGKEGGVDAPDAGKGGSGGGVEMTAVQRRQRTKEIRKKESDEVQADIIAEFERLRSTGVNPGKAMWQATNAANKKKVARDAARKKASRGDFAASAMAMFTDLEGEGEGGQADADGVVRTGDASLAAPFTSKKPSISAVVDVMRQGRCTLATLLHTYQIVALRALFSSYTNSVLYSMDVRWPQRPMIVVSTMYVHMALGLSTPKTPNEMAPIRPPSSVFHRSVFVSLLGQAATHVACMAFAIRVAKAHSAEDLPVKTAKGLLGPVFVPNLVSNAVFLLSEIQSVSVAVVNFKGRPFMAGALETSSVFLPAVSIVAFLFGLVLEIMPRANALLQLKPFPSAAAKLPILAAMIMSLVGPFAVDRACVRLFDPELHKARKAGPPLTSVAKLNLGLLGLLLVVVSLVVNNLDFDSLEETMYLTQVGLFTDAGLPPGWESGTDAATGRTYYVNHKTQVSGKGVTHCS